MFFFTDGYLGGIGWSWCFAVKAEGLASVWPRPRKLSYYKDSQVGLAKKAREPMKRTCHFRGLKLYTHCIGRSKKMSTWKYIKDERPVTRNYPLNISTELSFDCFNHSVSHVIIFMVSTLQASSQRMNIVRKKDKISVGLATKILSHSFRFMDILSFRLDSIFKVPDDLTNTKLYQTNRWKEGLGDWACEGALWTVCSLSGCGWSRVIKNYLNKITANGYPWGLGSLRHDACEEPVMGWVSYSSWYWYW